MPFQKQKTTAIVAGDDITVDFGERTRLNDIANAFRAIALGGARDGLGIDGTGVQDIPNYTDLRLDGTLLAGYTIQARVEVLTLDGGTTVEPLIYDVTTPGSPVLYTTTGGSASSSTSWARQTLVLDALPLAVKFNRLRVNKSNASALCLCLGYLELIAP